jgi:predicted RNA-binding Zn-ribbon protein involved in translation (DUF1610 family)
VKFLRRLHLIARYRCPRCGEGAIFRGSILREGLAVHPRCPQCGLSFVREQGYFVGAMYFGYGISIPPVLLLVAFFWFGLGWRYDSALLGAFLTYLPFVPWVARISRSAWIHLDNAFDPQETGKVWRRGGDSNPR